MNSNAAAILHESTGLTIRKNARNGFVVVTLRYDADPRKRSDAWRREAQAGMRPADWAQEYEIDYGAHSGERVFPEIVENRSRIIIPEPWPDFGPDAVYFGGMDYGARNPASLHYYTIYDGVIYCVWELYEPCRDIPAWVRKARSFPYYDHVRYIACDPSMYSKTTRNSQGLPVSPYELLAKAGLTKLIKGDNDEQVWIMQMRGYWADFDDPKFRILSCCPAMISEFENARFKEISVRASQTQNVYETMVDRNNHAMDDCKYFMSTRPNSTPYRKITWPSMVDRYKILR